MEKSLEGKEDIQSAWRSPHSIQEHSKEIVITHYPMNRRIEMRFTVPCDRREIPDAFPIFTLTKLSFHL